MKILVRELKMEAVQSGAGRLDSRRLKPRNKASPGEKNEYTGNISGSAQWRYFFCLYGLCVCVAFGWELGWTADSQYDQ